MTSETEVQQLRPARGLPWLATVAARELFPHWSLWLALTGLMALNLLWIGLDPRLGLSPRSILAMLVVGVGTPLALAYRVLRGRSFDRVLEALFLMLMVALFAGLFTQQVNLFSHLMMSLNLPLMDGRFIAWDEAVGFDWNAYAQAVGATARSRAVLLVSYSFVIPVAYLALVVVPILARRHERIHELAFLVSLSGFVCVTVAGLLPAYGAWETLATAQTTALLKGPFLQEMVAQIRVLRSGAPVSFNFRAMEGLASFPSFHACLAIIIIWCSRGRWYTALPGAVAGLVILAATPVYGGHYGVDLLGGAAVMAGAILLWRRLGPVLLSGRV